MLRNENLTRYERVTGDADDRTEGKDPRKSANKILNLENWGIKQNID